MCVALQASEVLQC